LNARQYCVDICLASGGPPGMAFCMHMPCIQKTKHLKSFVLQMDGSKMDGQPLATPDDCLEAEAIAKGSTQVQAREANTSSSAHRGSYKLPSSHAFSAALLCD
jgi:hypothetical protein